MKSGAIVSAMAVLAAITCLPMNSHAATLPVPAAAVSTVRMVRRSNSDWQSYDSDSPSLVTDASSASGRSTGVANHDGANPQLNGMTMVFAHIIYNSAQSNVNDGVHQVVQTVRSQYLAQPETDLNVRRIYRDLLDALLLRVGAIPELDAALHYAIAYITLIQIYSNRNGDERGSAYLADAVFALDSAGHQLWQDFDLLSDEYEDTAEAEFANDWRNIARLG